MSFKSAKFLLGGGHERVDRRMLQVCRERETLPMEVVDEEYRHDSTVQQSSLELLPRDIQLFIFGYMAIDDLNELTLTSRCLRYELVEPYLRSISKFIAEEQDGKLLNLMSLLMRNPCLESLIIDTKLTIAGGPGYFRSHSLCLAKCFKMLNPASLTTLILKGCVILNQDSMTLIASAFRNLTALDLSYMHHLKDSMLKKILSNNPHLVYLCLEKCYNAVNVYSIFYLPDLCPLLKTVSFSYCSNVDDACIQALGRLQHLQELSLAHCYDISSIAMANFCQSNKNLTILSLECRYLGDELFVFR
ncbi:hypothetical protein EON65_12290 [archaeon]|nr:MAG: hypothetical protein EON65_12290 [archaeon]